MKNVLIGLNKISIGYGRALMRPLSLEINENEFWGIVGPNGAGKTTLIKTMLRLIPPVAGEIVFRAQTPRFGYVPQRHSLNPSYPLTALDVALMGRYHRLRLGAHPKKQDKERVMEEFKRLGIETVQSRLYASLSGGQQQKVLMARALCSEPEILILDEPTSGMDIIGEADIMQFLKQLHSKGKITIIMISHDLEKVTSLVDHICLINKDTDLFSAGTVEELLSNEAISQLYRREISVLRFNGETHIRLRS